MSRFEIDSRTPSIVDDAEGRVICQTLAGYLGSFGALGPVHPSFNS